MDSKQHFKLALIIGDHNTGIFPDVAKCLVKGMGMPYTINVSERGLLYPNGSATGVHGMLYRGEVDVAAITYSRTMNEYGFDYSFPLQIGSLTFASRKYHEERNIFSLFNPFSFHVWLLMIFSFLLMTLVLYAFLRKRCKYGDILKSIISTVLGQSVTFKHRKEKLLMCSWLLGVMILINCYLSLLLSAVTVPPIHEIRNIVQLSEEVETRRYQVKSRLYSEVEMLSQSKEKSISIIGKSTKIVPNDQNSLKDFIPESKRSRLVLLDYRLFFDYLDDDFYISDDFFYISSGSLPVSKKFCCMEKLNRVIHRMVETGLVMKFVSDQSFYFKSVSLSSQNDVEDAALKPLSLSNLSGAFVILVCGHCAAILCLAVEVFMSRLVRTTRQRSPTGPSIVKGQRGRIFSFRGQSAFFSCKKRSNS